VTTSDGTGTSVANYTVTFSITGFSPGSGPPGTTVTVTGVGFLKAVGFKFGNVEAAGTIDSDTQITLTVPPGAQTAPISIGNGAVSVSSSQLFTVT
jgi:hypothetical protein